MFTFFRVPGGSLLDRLDSGPLPESAARDIFRQLLDGVAYLHDHGVTHRDLKPANVLLCDDKTRVSPLIKIADFGVARQLMDGNFMTTICGTFNYAAPEVLLQGNSFLGAGTRAMPYGKEVDMWSLGVILYCMLSGTHPFREEPGLPPLFDQITKGMYNFDPPAWKAVSPEAVDLVRGLLTVSTKDRLTARQGLQHSWFTERLCRTQLTPDTRQRCSNETAKMDTKTPSPQSHSGSAAASAAGTPVEYSVKTPKRKVRLTSQTAQPLLRSKQQRKSFFTRNCNNNNGVRVADDDDDDDDEIVEEDDDNNSTQEFQESDNTGTNSISPPAKRAKEDKYCTPPPQEVKFLLPYKISDTKNKASPLSVERSFYKDGNSRVTSRSDSGNVGDGFDDTDVVKQTPQQTDKKVTRKNKVCESLKKSLFFEKKII